MAVWHSGNTVGHISVTEVLLVHTGAIQMRLLLFIIITNEVTLRKAQYDLDG